MFGRRRRWRGCAAWLLQSADLKHPAECRPAALPTLMARAPASSSPLRRAAPPAQVGSLPCSTHTRSRSLARWLGQQICLSPLLSHRLPHCSSPAGSQPASPTGCKRQQQQRPHALSTGQRRGRLHVAACMLLPSPPPAAAHKLASTRHSCCWRCAGGHQFHGWCLLCFPAADAGGV